MHVQTHMVRQAHHDKLKILELGTTDTKGGAAAVSWALKKSLEVAGHEVNMIVGYKRSHDSSVREIWDAPINNFISKIIKRNFRARLHHHLAYWLLSDIALLPGKRILNFPEFKDADIIHAHNLHTLFFNLSALPALSQLKPFIWTLHDMWPIIGQGAHAFECEHWTTGGCDCDLPSSLPPFRLNNSRYLWNLKKSIYQRSRLHLVAPSQWLMSKVKQSILKDRPITVIYNGIDTNLFKPGNKDELRQKYGLPKDKKIILFSSKGGSKNIWKGWQYAEKVIAKYQTRDDIIFLCMGGYDREMENDTYKISYIPYTSDPAIMAEYYALSDILLYPSLADNCPLTVLEAMACGLPVLAFNTGGIPELVRHKQQGYIADYKNSSDLDNGLEWLLGLTPSQLADMYSSSRARAEEKFSLEKMVDNYLKLYFKVIDSPS